MRSILLPIHHEHVIKIINRTKQFEYRKNIPIQNLHKIIAYSTSPQKKIFMEFYVKTILKDSPKIIWQKTKKFSGISEKDFFNYFKMKDVAYAFEIEKVIEFENPKLLNEYGIKYHPQSFVYLKNKL